MLIITRYAAYVMAGILLGVALRNNGAPPFVPWLFGLCAVVGAAPVAVRAWQRRGAVTPRSIELAGHRCVVCGRDATGVLLADGRNPASWVYHCDRHLPGAVERLPRRRGARR